MIIKVFPSKHRLPREREVTISSNTYEVYSCMVNSEREAPWTIEDISIEINMNKIQVANSLERLQLKDLVYKTKDKEAWFTTPIEGRIKVERIQ